MATRVVTVAKANLHATILGSSTITFPLVVSASGGANVFTLAKGPAYSYAVAAATYTTITTLVTAFTAATPQGTSPALSTVLTFAKTGTKIKATVVATGTAGNGQHLTGTIATNTHLAGVNASGGVTGPARLWQTTIGYTGTPAPTATAGLFYPGTANDPMPVTIENQGTHSVFIAQGPGATAVTKTTGTLLAKGGSLTFSNIGTDKVYAIATTATVAFSVMVGRRP
jgi:hypothetical protein